MSNVDINQVLAQMRTISADAAGSQGNRVNENAGLDFSALLKQSIDKVNETQMNAGELKAAFEAGQENVELPEVMIAVQKAGISFQAMNQVRNKLLSAYQEIMNMPV